jgi:hypothetical protein
MQAIDRSALYALVQAADEPTCGIVSHFANTILRDDSLGLEESELEFSKLIEARINP